MNNWQDEWWKQIEKTAADFESWLVDVGEATETFTDQVSDNLETWFRDNLPADFVVEVDSFFQELAEVIITTADEIDAAFREDWEDLEHFSHEEFTTVSYQPPSAEKNPACINCLNYHGQMYNGNLLVCAMHPYGCQEARCPDWESEK